MLRFVANQAAPRCDQAPPERDVPDEQPSEGSDKGNTKAKPEIWTEADKFRAAAQKTQDEVGRLNAAARTGNLDQIKAAAGAAGESCKACHDNYRNK